MSAAPKRPAYAVALLGSTTIDDAIVAYLERINATLAPFGGRFLVHGGTAEPVEGEWPASLVVVAFPGMEEARAWYRSPAYREILPLRTSRVTGAVAIVEGVGEDHRATDILPALREATQSQTAA